MLSSWLPRLLVGAERGTAETGADRERGAAATGAESGAAAIRVESGAGWAENAADIGAPSGADIGFAGATANFDAPQTTHTVDVGRFARVHTLQAHSAAGCVGVDTKTLGGALTRSFCNGEELSQTTEGRRLRHAEQLPALPGF